MVVRQTPVIESLLANARTPLKLSEGCGFDSCLGHDFSFGEQKFFYELRTRKSTALLASHHSASSSKATMFHFYHKKTHTATRSASKSSRHRSQVTTFTSRSLDAAEMLFKLS